MWALVQGTGIRGQFEELSSKKTWRVIRNRNDIILLMKSMKLLSQHSAEARIWMSWKYFSNLLFARGELQLVGATTLSEYRIIEKDAAKDGMQPVKVDEPTVEETITISKGIQKKY